MKAIHKLEQNEFHAQKKSILIVASFLLHCNLSAKQNAVTSHRSLRALCSPKQYLFSRGSTPAESNPRAAPSHWLREQGRVFSSQSPGWAPNYGWSHTSQGTGHPWRDTSPPAAPKGATRSILTPANRPPHLLFNLKQGHVQAAWNQHCMVMF